MKNVDLVVGIPRSGMLPANLIAMYLNKPFTDINSFLEIHPRYFDFHKDINRSDYFNDTYDHIVINAIIIADDENNYHQTLFV